MRRVFRPNSNVQWTTNSIQKVWSVAIFLYFTFEFVDSYACMCVCVCACMCARENVWECYRTTNFKLKLLLLPSWSSQLMMSEAWKYTIKFLAECVEIKRNVHIITLARSIEQINIFQGCIPKRPFKHLLKQNILECDLRRKRKAFLSSKKNQKS